MAHLKDIATTKDKIYQGECLCRCVRFCLTDPLRQALICHCRDCFQIAGLSWDSSTSVQDESFDLTASQRLAGMTARLGPNADFAEIALLCCFIA